MTVSHEKLMMLTEFLTGAFWGSLITAYLMLTWLERRIRAGGALLRLRF
jgi:hypothetical protein